MNDIVSDAEGGYEGRYGGTGGPIWVHVRADIGTRELALLGLESLAVSARVVTKHFVTIFSKTCNKQDFSKECVKEK